MNKKMINELRILAGLKALNEGGFDDAWGEPKAPCNEEVPNSDINKNVEGGHVLYSGPLGDLVAVGTFEALVELGRGSAWSVAQPETGEEFFDHHSQQGSFYVWFDRNGERILFGGGNPNNGPDAVDIKDRQLHGEDLAKWRNHKVVKRIFRNIGAR